VSATEGYSIQGGCACGAIRFGLTEPPTLAGYCHCTRCQARTGSAASAQARIDGATFRLLQGEEQLGIWSPEGTVMTKCFCTRCGSHVFSRSTDGTNMSIRMSAFDTDPGVRPSYRQFLAYAASWEPIPDDGLERFDQARPKRL